MFPGVSGGCALCGAIDGMSHRIYECPASEEIRVKNDWDFLKDEQRSVLVYGLFPRPKALDEYQKALYDIHITDLQFLPDSEETAYIFTDGSCTQPLPSRVSEHMVSDWHCPTAIKADCWPPARCRGATKRLSGLGSGHS